MNLISEHWRKDWTMMGVFFTKEQTDFIYQRLASMQPAHLAFCAFENRFARSGGLAAVTAKEIPFLKEINQFKKACLVSPYYPHIMATAPLAKSTISFSVPFAAKEHPVEVYTFENEYTEPHPGSLTEYFIKAEGFFSARNRLKDPYIYFPDDSEKNDEALQNNALFFVTAVPHLLAAIGFDKDTILHAQDWQTALLTLTIKQAVLEQQLHSAAVVITMHNPYDSFIPSPVLKNILHESLQKRVEETKIPGWNAFAIGLSLADGPNTTVSDHFAGELQQDPIQIDHFAPHLQPIFQRRPVVGVNNGPFVAFSTDFPRRDQHTIRQIAEIKKRKRAVLLQILETYLPDERFGQLTYQRGSIRNLPEEIPILFMNGRLDPVQKGYDVLLRAVERFGRDEIKLIVTPMPVHEEDLDIFHEIASKCRGNVTVYPIRMEKGFQELLTGSTYGVMPSIYEPFGAALDFMANGTAVIARNTGGLANQVTDGLNGFLFREEPHQYTVANITAFAAQARLVQARKFNPWMVDMVDALYDMLCTAKNFYVERRRDYHELIRQGFIQAAKFSWEKSAREYGQVYRCVTR